MENKIQKLSSSDEKMLLSEMEMLEVYGGNQQRRGGTYQVSNGCRCKNCGTENSSYSVSNCGNGNQNNCPSGSTSSSGSSGSSGYGV